MEFENFQLLSCAPYQFTYGDEPIYEYGSYLRGVGNEPMAEEMDKIYGGSSDVDRMVFYSDDRWTSRICYLSDYH